MPRRIPKLSPGAAAGRALVSVALLALAAFLVWEPVEDLLLEGTFQWTVAQPATQQGFLEVVALYLLLLAALLAARRRAIFLALAAIPLLLYLRRHHVDLAALGVAVYVEGLIALGAALERRVAGPRPADLLAYLRWFLAGLALWATLIAAASGFHLAAPQDLRILFAVLAAAAFAVARRLPLLVHLVRGLGRLRVPEKAVAAFVPAFAAALLARSNSLPGYDSLWYGLRGDLVLAPEGSIFDSLGLVASVHYYPKLLEALLLPLSGLGDLSLLTGFNLAFLLLLCLVAYVLAVRLGLDGWKAGLAAVFMLSLPAAAGIAVGTKADLLAALLLALAALFFWRYLDGGGRADALLGLAAASLSTVAKLTSLPYVALLVLATAALGFALRGRGRSGRDEEPSPRSVGWLTVGLAAAGTGAFFLRTYLLAGMPTIIPDRLWSLLGFSLRPPVGLVVRERSHELVDVPGLVWSFLVSPNDLRHVRLTWTGNVWFFLLVCALVAAIVWRFRSRPPAPVATWLGVLGAGVVFALLFNNSVPGGDGNYYLFPLLLALLLSLRTALARAGPVLPAVAVALTAFAVQQSVLSFVTCRWDPGKRAWDTDFTRSPFDTRSTRQRVLADYGLAEIGEHLERQAGVERVVGQGPNEALLWLPARYESLDAMKSFKPNPLGSPEAFVRYLHDHRIDYALRPQFERRGVAAAALDFLEQQPGVAVMETGLYRLVDLRPLRERLPRLAETAPPAARDPEVFYRFATSLDLATAMKGQGSLEARWGKRIAVANSRTSEYTGHVNLVMYGGTELEYEVPIPALHDLVLHVQVGFYPRLSITSGSDGCIAAVEVTPEGGGAPRRESRELKPGEGFVPIRLPLSDLRGQVVRVRFSVSNPRGSHEGRDLIVWGVPQIEAAPPPGP